MFLGGLTDPQLRLQLRLVLPYFLASKLAYCCFMDEGKRSKALGSDRSSYFSQHSKQHQHQHVDTVSLDPQVPRGGTEARTEALYPCGGLHCRKGALSLRTLLFYRQWWASLLSVLETVPQGYSEQKHAWKMTQVKSRQGLAFLAYFAKCVGVGETPWKIVPVAWMTKTELTDFLKTCPSVSSLGEGHHLLCESPKAKLTVVPGFSLLRSLLVSTNLWTRFLWLR